MKTILIAVFTLIATYAFADVTKLTFSPYSAAGTNDSVTCSVMTAEDSGAGVYFSPSANRTMLLRGVTKKYSSAYYAPSAAEKYMKIVCYNTTTAGPTSTSPYIKVYLNGETTNYYPIKDSMLKCH